MLVSMASTPPLRYNSPQRTDEQTDDTSLQYGPNSSGDRGLSFDQLRVGAGVIHLGDRILEGVFTCRNNHPHHSCFLF